MDYFGYLAATTPHGQPGQKHGHGKERGGKHLQQKTIREWHGQRTRRNREQRKHFKVDHLARPFAVRGEIFRPGQFVRHRQR